MCGPIMEILKADEFSKLLLWKTDFIIINIRNINFMSWGGENRSFHNCIGYQFWKWTPYYIKLFLKVGPD